MFIKCHCGNDFLIGIAGYPEKHPQTKSTEEDILNLKRKVNYSKIKDDFMEYIFFRLLLEEISS